jgi:hypothetical protein
MSNLFSGLSLGLQEPITPEQPENTTANPFTTYTRANIRTAPRTTNNPPTTMNTETNDDSSSFKSIIPKPNDYDGNPRNFQQFYQQVQLYILANPRHFNDDFKKVALVLSLCKTGSAALWATTLIRNFIRENKWPTWEDFQPHLQRQFQDRDQVLQAQARLQTMKQGNQSIYFFINRWESTVREAGMDPNEHFSFLRLRLCQGIDPSILQTMTASVEGIPDKYENFWNACMRIHEERRWLHTLNESQKTSNNWTPHTTNYNPP